MAVELLELIENVRAHKCLYDTNYGEYRNFVAKRDAWLKVSSKLKIPYLECKLKWYDLRNSYLSALKRRQTTKNFKKWKYENEMKFLLPFMGVNGRGPNTKNDDEADDCHETQDEDYLTGDLMPEKRIIDYHEESPQTIIKRTHLTEVDDKNNNSVRTPGMSTIQKHQDEVLKSLKEKMEKKKDEIDLLFQSLAIAVKKLPKSEQLNMKVDITNLVYEAQMRCENP